MDIYIWSIIVRIVHICSCIISIPILGVITLYRVCSYLLILLLPLWGTDSVHLGMVFFVYGVHIHLILLLQYTEPIYMSGIITTSRVYSFRYHNLYRYRWYLESIKPEFFLPGVHILLHQYNLLQYQSGKWIRLTIHKVHGRTWRTGLCWAGTRLEVLPV